MELELSAALSLRVRLGDLARKDALEVSNLFDTHLRDSLYVRHRLTTEHYRLARSYITRFDLPLKSPDALHLALCSAEDLMLITADRQLARNADSLGVRAELVGS